LLDTSNMRNKSIKKLYYSISEVSKITGLKQYVLRFWETEFPDLKPAKNRAGNRIYRLSDIKLVFLIKKLLYEDKYTIEGARQKMKLLDKLKSKSPQMAMPFQENKKNLVRSLRKDLQEILEILDGKK